MVSFHVEPTSKCTLECPACDRTWFYNTFKKRLLHDIDIDDLVKFVGSSAEIEFMGNNGDPIYHSNFIEMCTKLKETNCKLHITTNGSSKTPSWWEKLNNVLNEDDKLTFSIDGLEDTNHLYRKNAKWESIMSAVKVFKKGRKCKLEWKFILFKHNQHQLEDVKQFSKDAGFDDFKYILSNRWLDGDDYMPDTKYVDKYFEHQEMVISDKNYKTAMRPNCLIDNKPSNQLYIDAEGNFYPCCWMGTYRHKFKSLFSPRQNQFNIKNNSLMDILNNKEVKDFFNSTNRFTSANECCKLQCGVKNG